MQDGRNCTPSTYNYLNKRIGVNRPLIFTVECLVSWPLNESEAGVDLVLIDLAAFLM